MLNRDYTTELLNLEDVIVTKVENICGQLHVHLHLPRKAHTCPACGAVTDRVHDYREQLVKDVPLGRDSFLHLRKRRYVCSCGKRFAEKNPFLPRYYRATSRLITSVIESFRKAISATEVASRFNISVTTAIRYFDCVNYRCKELPEELSIDEFKGNAGGEKCQSILTDPQHTKVLDILPNRYESDLIQYFKQFPSRFDVKYFVSDMNPHFRNVAKICFPNAILVADRFHVVRQINWTMENVRKNEQKKLSPSFRKYFKRSKSLLRKNMEKLKEEDMDRLALMFEISPRLADAYYMKNKLYEIMKSENSEVGKKKLADWLFQAELLEMKEFEPCIKAYRNWLQEILNAMDCPWTNGFTEGCNNKTKVLKRACYGVSNFCRFRNRRLHLGT